MTFMDKTITEQETTENKPSKKWLWISFIVTVVASFAYIPAFYFHVIGPWILVYTVLVSIFFNLRFKALLKRFSLTEDKAQRAKHILKGVFEIILLATIITALPQNMNLLAYDIGFLNFDASIQYFSNDYHYHSILEYFFPNNFQEAPNSFHKLLFVTTFFNGTFIVIFKTFYSFGKYFEINDKLFFLGWDKKRIEDYVVVYKFYIIALLIICVAFVVLTIPFFYSLVFLENAKENTYLFIIYSFVWFYFFLLNFFNSLLTTTHNRLVGIYSRNNS